MNASSEAIMPTGNDLKDLGLAHYRAGRFEEASAAFAQAQQAWLASGDTRPAAEAANDRGVAARQAARFDEAEAAFNEARELFEELGDRRSQGQVIGNLGALAESRSQNERAAAFYKEAIALFEQVGESDLASETWRALSRLRLKQGKWFAAMGAYDAGLQGVKRLTPTQGVLRRLLKVSRRLMGGG
jgi:tetratricopeptide (TPR) repeat protein